MCSHPKGILDVEWYSALAAPARLIVLTRPQIGRKERTGCEKTFVESTLVILFVSVNELCVHIPKESSMWNDIQHSRFRLGPWNWLDLRWDELRDPDAAHLLLKATLVISFVLVNELCVHVPKEFSTWNDIQHSQLWLGWWNRLGLRWGERRRSGIEKTFVESTLVILFVSVNELCVHIPKEFSMWNNIQHSQLRLGSWNWLGLRLGERRDPEAEHLFLKASLVILFVSVNELCVHIPKELSMWNDIQHSQLRLGSWNWLHFRWVEMRGPEAEHPFLKATLVILFVSVNELCVHNPKESSMWNDIQHSQLRSGAWNWLEPRWGEQAREWNLFWKPSQSFYLYWFMNSVFTSQRNSRCGIIFSTRSSN